MRKKVNFCFDFHASEKGDTTVQGNLAKILDILIEKKIYKHTFDIPLVIVFQVYINYSH